MKAAFLLLGLSFITYFTFVYCFYICEEISQSVGNYILRQQYPYDSVLNAHKF